MSQLPHKAALVRGVRRAVVKIGRNVIAGSDGLRLPRIRALASEVAALVAWLASEECSFSTGAVYDLSGGRATY